jgi:hypothetical protein
MAIGSRIVRIFGSVYRNRPFRAGTGITLLA